MNPFVSIVYLTRNGGDLFRKSLDAVLAQQADFPFDVIAVDSGSTDGTRALLNQRNVKAFNIDPATFNFGLTRDYAFSLAQGEIIITLSQDVVPASNDWLRLMTEPFNDPHVAVVQGCDIVPPDEELFFWYANNLFYYTRDTVKWNDDNGGIGLSFTSCAIRRSVWAENHIGRADMNEDKVFQLRLKGKRFKLVLQPLAKTYHAHMYSMRELAKRCENEGMGWRLCALEYTATDMLMDMFNTKILCALVTGVFAGKVKRLAELFFPFIRPYYLYKGNHFTSGYIK